MGGPALHVSYLSAGLIERGYETTLVAGSVSPGEQSMAYVAEEQGVPVHLIPHLHREISPVQDILATFRLARMIREQRPHILHTHTAKAGAIGRVAAVLAGKVTAADRRAHVPRPRAARLLRPLPHGDLPQPRALARARRRHADRRQPGSPRRPGRAEGRAAREVHRHPPRDRARRARRRRPGGARAHAQGDGRPRPPLPGRLDRPHDRGEARRRRAPRVQRSCATTGSTRRCAWSATGPSASSSRRSRASSA